MHSIADSLKIPFISIKWENEEEENSIIAQVTSLLSSRSSSEHEEEDEESDDESVEYKRDYNKINQINLHPPSHTIVNAIIDLITFYKWEFVTVLFQESTGLDRIQDLLRLPGRKQNGVENKIRLQVRQLGKDVSKWIYLIKDVKLSGCSFIIVDIEDKFMNKFLDQATEVGLATTYFHFLFTTLNLNRLEYLPSANVTAFQVHDLNIDADVKRVHFLFNAKNLAQRKAGLEFLPVNIKIILLEKICIKNFIKLFKKRNVFKCSF